MGLLTFDVWGGSVADSRCRTVALRAAQSTATDGAGGSGGGVMSERGDGTEVEGHSKMMQNGFYY